MTTIETTDTGTIRNITKSTDISKNFILPIPETVDNGIISDKTKQKISASPDKSFISENDSRMLSRQSSTEKNLLDNAKHDLYENEDVSLFSVKYFSIYVLS